MATLLTDQTSDTVTSGEEITGPCTVHFSGVFGGAVACIETAASDTSSDYTQYSSESEVDSPKPVNVNIYGTYYLRIRQRDSGGSTSISAETTQ